MYPLAKDTLNLREIALHWPRDLPQHPPSTEVMTILVAAIWGNELRVMLGPGHPSLHEWLLSSLAKSYHPGILIYDDGDTLIPAVRPTADGGVIVDVRNRVHLPRDSATWTPETICQARKVLAKCTISDYSDAFTIFLALLKVTREDFASFCDIRGYERPDFWFRVSKASRKKALSFAGRPSIMRAIEQELNRRANAGDMALTLRAEAQALHAWAKRAYPDRQIPTGRAIENGLRGVYWRLRRGMHDLKHKT